MANRLGRTQASYYRSGSHDPTIPIRDSETESTYTVGEQAGATMDPVPEYTGPVLLVSGDHDALVCGAKASCLPLSNSPVAKTKPFFLDAASFDYSLANQSGHLINFHYSARQTYRAIHDWIDSKFEDRPGNGIACHSTNTMSTGRFKYHSLDGLLFTKP